MYSKHQLVCSPGLGEYDGLGRIRVGRVFKKIVKKLNPVRILKRTIRSTRKRIKNPKMILKDIRRQALRASTLGASDLYEKNVKRRRKKFKARTGETVAQMKVRGATQADIDSYMRRRREKLKHRRKKVQRGVRGAVLVGAAIAGAVVFGPGLLASMGSGGATAGAGAGAAGASAGAVSTAGGSSLLLGGAKMVGGALLPMVIQKAVGGGGAPAGQYPEGLPQPGQFPGAPGVYPGEGYYGGTGQPGQYTGPGASVIGGYQRTMEQAGINPIVPIALLGAGLAVFLILR